MPEAMQLRPYQQSAIDAVHACIRDGAKSMVLALPTGAGKCLGLGTPVLKYDGSILAVEDVLPGHLLMGPDSRPRVVLSTTSGRGPLYRIVPVKGAPWVCNDVHVLTLVHTESGEIVDIPLNEYLAKSRWWKHCHKMFAPEQPVEFSAVTAPTVSPYFVGIWIGDGTHNLHGVAISKPDVEIELAVRDEAARWGLEVRVDGPPHRCPSYHVHGVRGKGNPLLAEMRRLFGDSMAIPREYLTGTVAVRQELLAGIIDTDGYVHNGSCEVTQRRNGLAHDIAFLARSLGFRVLISEKVVNDIPYVRLSISGDLETLPMRIPRKQSPTRRQKKVATRTGFTVESIGDGEYAGFELDGDGRFLLGDFTVTHNTAIACHLMREFPKPIVFLCHRDELVNQTWDQVNLWLPNATRAICKAEQGRDVTDLIGRDVIIASAQTLAREPRLDVLKRAVGNPPLMFCDEAHHSAAATWRRTVEVLAPEILIGLTATPKRGDGKGLDDIFQTIAYSVPMSALVDLGQLARPIGLRIGTSVDLSSVATRQGDFAQGELTAVVNTPERNQLVVDAYRKHASDRKASIAFCVDVAHVEALTAKFRENGIMAESIVGTTPTDERREIYDLHRRGVIPVIVSCMVLTEGFDQPVADCALMCRPTQSQSLYIQMAGRVLRYAPNKPNALIVDFVDLTRRHSLATILSLKGDDDPDIPAPDAEEEYDLFGAVKDEAERKARIKRASELLGDLLATAQHHWITMEDGTTFAPTGEGAWLAVIRDSEGYVPVQVFKGAVGRSARLVRLFDRPADPQTAMEIATNLIPANKLTDPKAGWRDGPASTAQMDFARRLRIRPPEGITKGGLSELIDREIFKRALTEAR